MIRNTAERSRASRSTKHGESAVFQSRKLAQLTRLECASKGVLEEGFIPVESLTLQFTHPAEGVVGIGCSAQPPVERTQAVPCLSTSWVQLEHHGFIILYRRRILS